MVERPAHVTLRGGIVAARRQGRGVQQQPVGVVGGLGQQGGGALHRVPSVEVESVALADATLGAQPERSPQRSRRPGDAHRRAVNRHSRTGTPESAR